MWLRCWSRRRRACRFVWRRKVVLSACHCAFRISRQPSGLWISKRQERSVGSSRLHLGSYGCASLDRNRSGDDPHIVSLRFAVDVNGVEFNAPSWKQKPMVLVGVNKFGNYKEVWEAGFVCDYEAVGGNAVVLYACSK